MARLEEKVDNLSDDMKAVILKLDSLDEKFSAKWVEKAMAWIIIAIVGAVVAALVNLVLIKHPSNVSALTDFITF